MFAVSISRACRFGRSRTRTEEHLNSEAYTASNLATVGKRCTSDSVTRPPWRKRDWPRRASSSASAAFRRACALQRRRAGAGELSSRRDFVKRLQPRAPEQSAPVVGGLARAEPALVGGVRDVPVDPLVQRVDRRAKRLGPQLDPRLREAVVEERADVPAVVGDGGAAPRVDEQRGGAAARVAWDKGFVHLLRGTGLLPAERFGRLCASRTRERGLRRALSSKSNSPPPTRASRRSRLPNTGSGLAASKTQPPLEALSASSRSLTTRTAPARPRSARTSVVRWHHGHAFPT